MPETPEAPATPPTPAGLLSKPWLLIAVGVGACAVCGCLAVGLAFATGVAPKLMASLLPGRNPAVEGEPTQALSYEDRYATEAAQSQPTTSNSAVSPNQGAFQSASRFAGDWEGGWTNQTFGSTGAARVTIDITPDGTATLTLDLDGLVFGLVDPDPATYSGSYTDGGAVFSVSDDPVFGELSIVVDPQGSVIVRAPDVPASQILSLSATGSITPETMHLEYTVLFPDGTPAQGVLDLEKSSP